jgi:hypothetical protein
MRRTVWLVLAAFALATGAQAYNGWGIFASYWNTSDAGDGFGPGLKISAEMVPGVQLELRGSYFSSLEDEVSAADIEVIPLEAGLALTGGAGTGVTLLAGAGAGYCLVDAVGADDEVSYYFVGGAEWSVRPNAALFAEIKYTVLEVDGLSPEKTDLTGPGASAGLLIRW